MRLKRLLSLAVLMALPSVSSVLAADDLPQPLSFARYNPMLDHSPFAVATAAAPVAAAPNFAKDLFVANAAHSTGCDLVTIASNTDRNLKEYLTTKNPVHGYTIANIEWSDRVGATKVTISKNGEFATLGFNEALLTQPIQNAGQNIPAPMPPPMGAVPQANPMKFPNAAAMPSYPTPVPRVRGMIQRRPQVKGVEQK